MSSSSRTNTKAGVGVGVGIGGGGGDGGGGGGGGGIKMSGAEVLTIGIVSQGSGVKKAFGEAEGVGTIGRVLNEPIHGTSP